MNESEVFKQGSTTYYNASKLFPKAVRGDVAKLYSFVRVADNFVDATPQDIESFEKLVSRWHGMSVPTSRQIESAIENIREVRNKYSFDPAWIDAFLQSMKMDTYKSEYRDISELREYIYGSAEVIGLMMAKIMNVPADAYDAARAQGRAMQLINFIRDIDEDVKLGRTYLPQNEMQELGLHGLDKESAEANTAAFKAFIAMQLERYRNWQAEADAGIHAIPRKYRAAVKTANDGYTWTAKKIAADPFIVFREKSKPPKRYLYTKAVIRMIGM